LLRGGASRSSRALTNWARLREPKLMTSRRDRSNDSAVVMAARGSVGVGRSTGWRAFAVCACRLGKGRRASRFSRLNPKMVSAAMAPRLVNHQSAVCGCWRQRCCDCWQSSSPEQHLGGQCAESGRHHRRRLGCYRRFCTPINSTTHPASPHCRSTWSTGRGGRGASSQAPCHPRRTPIQQPQHASAGLHLSTAAQTPPTIKSRLVCQEGVAAAALPLAEGLLGPMRVDVEAQGVHCGECMDTKVSTSDYRETQSASTFATRPGHAFRKPVHAHSSKRAQGPTIDVLEA
jgi:hypothetical protein